MFPFHSFRKPARNRRTDRQVTGLEPLEGRQLLSASLPTDGPPQGGPGGFGGPSQNSIEFSLAPAAVQTGLNALATADGLTDPTSTTVVSLGNRDGVETYSVTLNSTGTVSRLTVDAAGNPVTAPTQSTTTFSALPTAAATEITAIAAAQSLTAPTADTVINVSTTAAGVATYSVHLDGDDSTTTTSTDDHGRGPGGGSISVDASGNPVGDQRLPFSVFSSTIQSALNAGAPSGATALDGTSTQTVSVRTADGITTYSTTFTVDSTDTTVTVDASGATVTPASKTTADFSTIPTAAQTELQALATAKGYTGTIDATETVTVYTETGGTTTLYAVTLSVSDDASSDTTRTHDVTLVVDAAGNPTTLPMGQGGPGNFGGPGGDRGEGGPGGHGGGGRHGGPDQGPPSDGGSGDDGSSSGSSSSSSSSGTVTASAASSSSSSSTTGTTAVSGASVGKLIASVLAADTPATPTLGAALGLFGSAAINTTVIADLAQLKTDADALRSTVKGLSKTDAATLKADQKALAAAIKALNGTLAPAKKALKSDAAKYAAVLRADQRAIRKDAKDADALAADQEQLAADQSAAFAALSADLDALRSLIAADAGVTAAEAKITTDLPTVAAAQATVVSDYDQLQDDVGAALS